VKRADEDNLDLSAGARNSSIRISRHSRGGHSTRDATRRDAANVQENASQGTSSLVRPRPSDNDNVLTVLNDSEAMANIAAQRIKREFKEVIKSEEVSVESVKTVESTAIGASQSSRVLSLMLAILAISYNSGRVSRYYAIPAIGI